MSLRLKFNLALALAFAVGLAAAAAILHWMTLANAREEVLQNARIMMESADAIGAYTARDIEPLLATQITDRFLPESIPFFAAQANFKALQRDYPDYVFKEAALNPTNPSDRASDWEADIINAFRHDAKLPELMVERMTPTGPSLALSRPIRVTDEACLQCHSTPARAPLTMIRLYGTANGFGWKPNETVGASIVSVPMSVALRRATQTFWMSLGVLAATYLIIVVLLNILLQYMVIRPVVKMAHIAGQVSLGDLNAEEYQKTGRDEIASLSTSFNRMRRSLETAMKLLNK